MKRLVTIFFVQTIFLYSLSATGNTRLAIGSFGLSEKRDADLADLIAVRLSKEAKLDLVERRELDKALNETALKLTGLAKAKDTVRVGALLRVDRFLLGTSVSINGTNRVIVRLVDARSGAIRSINVFPDSTSLATLAENIGRFANAEIGQPAPKERDYLAIGVIQNLGVNNRFADFPAQLRGSIAANLSGKVTVLERDVISFLADEVRLNLAGLTESTGKTNTPVQFAFWIVDGFYQSYEVAEPEVQVQLRLERLQGGKVNAQFKGKPDEKLFAQISKKIAYVFEYALQNPKVFPPLTASAASQTEIKALEARGQQLADYVWTKRVFVGSIRLRTASNPDKVMNTLDEATRVYESILLLDPDNVPAKMRLAGCLLFEAEKWGGIKRDHLAERKARADNYYQEVIATGDPEYKVEAQICLAESYGFRNGGVELLRRFLGETIDAKAREIFHRSAREMLREIEYSLPVEVALPYLRTDLFDELRDLEKRRNEPFIVSFEGALSGYGAYPERREKAINTLLPEILENFPDLKPYILLAAASEQTDTNAPLIAQFLASLRQCEEHPESVLHPSSYFTHLSSTEEAEKAISQFGGTYVPKRIFDLHQYSTVIAMTLARQRAAEKGLAPPLTATGKRWWGDSYAGLGQWQKALDIYTALPDVSPQVINECRKHLKMDLVSEAVPDSAWKDKSDMTKVKMAYDCVGREQWLTAAAILDSIGHRTVQMSGGGSWGVAFAPVLPAEIANQYRAKAGKPALQDPVRFELGDTPYVHFLRDGPKYFSFEAEGDDLWIATYSQIKRFAGAGPFDALNPMELHEFKRATRSAVTSICLSSNFIWTGTQGEGLFELDRKTGQIRHFTVKDGLWLDNISGLYLQGHNLWIAWRNGEEGGVGTLDLQTHKFSALTPWLSNEAGLESQPFNNQHRVIHGDRPLQLPISGMTEGAEDMWFAVSNKGLQSYRHSDRRWRTIIIPNYLSDVAADIVHQKVLVTSHEYGTLDGEKSRTGGLFIYDIRQDKLATMQIHEGLPSNDLTSVATDGTIAWIGGRGFIAVVDTENQKVLRIAYLSASYISKIQLGKKYAWIQVVTGGEKVGGHQSVVFPGSAWTGVYRVERSLVERTNSAAGHN